MNGQQPIRANDIFPGVPGQRQLISAGCGPGRYMVLGVADSRLMVMSLLKDGFNIQQLKLPFAKEVTEVMVVTFCRWY